MRFITRYPDLDPYVWFNVRLRHQPVQTEALNVFIQFKQIAKGMNISVVFPIYARLTRQKGRSSISSSKRTRTPLYPHDSTFKSNFLNWILNNSGSHSAPRQVWSYRKLPLVSSFNRWTITASDSLSSSSDSRNALRSIAVCSRVSKSSNDPRVALKKR